MKTKIKWVSEAFSMQPQTFMIGNKFNVTKTISRIDLEVQDETTNIYVGYSKENEKLFQLIANACNVGYF